MKRPSPIAYLIGNPICATVIVLGFAWSAYAALAAHGSGTLALVMCVLAVAASKSYTQVNNYRHWEREWNIMGAGVPKSNVVYRSPTLQILVVAVIFNLAMFLAHGFLDGQMKSLLTYWWWGFNGVLVAFLAYRLFTVWRSRTGRTMRDMPVTVCVPVPAQSMDARQTYPLLPDYCRGLLAD